MEIGLVSNCVLFSIFTHVAVNVFVRVFKFICEVILQVYNMRGIAGFSSILCVQLY